MYDTILVPTDGSGGAEAAAGHALNLAAAFGSRIHVLSVVDERTGEGVPRTDWKRNRDRDGPLEEHARDAVGALEETVVGAGVECRTAVQHGSPHEEILAYAGDHGVDVVAMGTHGRTGLSRLLLGSVTERIVRTSDVPVLSSRRQPDGDTYDRILVPTDGSDTASAAVDHALGLAEQFGATVHAVAVIDTSALAGAFDGGPVVDDVVADVTEGCERAVAGVADRCADRGVAAVTAVEQGTPYRVLADYVDEAGIDIVAMGTHGRRGVGRYLLGSVTERVVRTSDVPVLSVPRPT
jgi:nucleotide-binding universal stress UspA family protein